MKLTQANKTIALAGIFQAAILIKQFATTGEVNANAFRASLDSIFKIDAPDVPAVFGGVNGVQLGLQNLVLFGSRKPPFKDTVLMRYVLSVMHFAKKLQGNPALTKKLRHRLEPAISQANHFSPEDPIVINHLSTIYSRIFVDMNLRIPILGKFNLLKQETVMEKVRALLFAGVRAAFLWYQVGGNRWELFLTRRQIRQHATLLLKNEWQSVLSK